MDSTSGIRKGDILVFSDSSATKPEFRGCPVEVVAVEDAHYVRCRVSKGNKSWDESIHIKRLDPVTAHFVGSDELDLMFSEISG